LLEEKEHPAPAAFETVIELWTFERQFFLMILKPLAVYFCDARLAYILHLIPSLKSWMTQFSKTSNRIQASLVIFRNIPIRLSKSGLKQDRKLLALVALIDAVHVKGAGK